LTATTDARRREESTQMFVEASQGPAVVAAQLDANQALLSRIGARLRTKPPRAVVTAARGSSDHVATFAKYLIETKTGTITSSAGLSTSSVYTPRANFDSVLFLAISQSGRSPDLLSATEEAKKAGAFTIAAVNAADSPLAALADEVIPLHAGPELSVAATKTYLASAAAVVHLVADWRQDAAMEEHLARLPDLMTTAWSLDWTPAVSALRSAHHLFVIGRGLGFGAAQEAALKFKETCALHAEAFSAAEVQHGPMALVKDGFPVLVLSQDDGTRPGISALVEMLAPARAQMLLAGLAHADGRVLPVVSADPILQPILMIQSFYRMANALSLARGLDPDRPSHLNKITETV
jgi:glucosamine--fructose-6-phosphate aminotransferase (isomerizing)